MYMLTGAPGMMLGSSSVLSRLWQLGIQSEKLKSFEYKQSEVDEAISRITSADSHYGLRVAGPLLLGISRIHARRVDMYESRIHAVSAHIETVLHSSGGFVAQSARKSVVRKRSMSSVNLLPSLPEMDSFSLDGMPSLDEVMFDPIEPLAIAHTPSRTPSSASRRDRSVSRRAITPIPEDDFAFDTAMTPVDPLDLSSKRRRLSSVSEVMDSLRADDGTRRMSGILGSMTDVSLPGTPLMFEDPPDDFGVPDSPWPMQPNLHQEEARVEVQVGGRSGPRNPVNTFLRKNVDKKGKQGIELDRVGIAKKREEILRLSGMGLGDIIRLSAKFCVFPLASVVGDNSSHFKWYVPSRQVRVRPEVVRENLVEESEIMDVPDWEDHSVGPVVTPAPALLMDRLGDSSASIESVLFPGKALRKTIVPDFMELLNLASRGIVQIGDGPVDFTNKSLGKRVVVRG